MNLAEKYSSTSSHPKGTVLIFTMVILLLMGLMGIAILLNTRTELSISYNTNVGREAFNRADMAASIATLMARVLLRPELGEPKDLVRDVDTSDDASIIVNYDEVRFDRALMREEAMNNFDPTARYLKAGSFVEQTDTSGTNIGNNSMTFTADTPSIVFRQKGGKIIATAVVAMDYGEVNIEGMSLDGGNFYDPSGGSTVRVVLLVSVNGHPPVDNTTSNAFDGGDKDLPSSVITTIFQEYI